MRIIAIIAIVYAVITEFLDWHGRAEIIERRFPKTWAVIGSRSARIVLILFAVGLLLVPREGAAPETQPHVAPAGSPAPESAPGGGSAQSSPAPDKGEPKQPSQEPLMVPLPNAKPRKSAVPLLAERSPMATPAKSNSDIAHISGTADSRSSGAVGTSLGDGQQSTQLASNGGNTAGLEATRTTASTGQADHRAEKTQVDETASNGTNQSGTTAEAANARVGDLNQTIANIGRPDGSGRPKRVVVLDFDYATVAANSTAIFGQNVDIGKGMADLVARNLVESGKYVVIDRKAVDKILAERNFSTSDRADPMAAAKLGKLLGADAVIVGSITQFGNDARRASVADGGAGSGADGILSGMAGVSHKKSKTVVTLDTRVIDLDTGEIEAVASGKGEASRTSATLAGTGGTWHGWGAGEVDFGSSDFQQTILGEAVNSAVKQTSAELVADESKVASHEQAVEGMIAAVDGNMIVLNVGRKNGLTVGDELNVRRTAREITDPATGSVTRHIDSSVGVVKLTDVDDVSAVASAVSGSGFKVGDKVKLVTPQQTPASAEPQH